LVDDIKKQIHRLEREILEVYEKLVLPTWGKEMHGFPQTLYGYMMEVFSYIDLMSAYWKGNENDQTKRMIGFMNKYIRDATEKNSVSVQVWRHKLMHTANPRILKNNDTNKQYQWLLHWYEHLPIEQHFTFSETTDRKILNIGLVYLVRDIEGALSRYEENLSNSQELENNFKSHSSKLEAYEYRDIAP